MAPEPTVPFDWLDLPRKVMPVVQKGKLRPEATVATNGMASFLVSPSKASFLLHPQPVGKKLKAFPFFMKGVSQRPLHGKVPPLPSWHPLRPLGELIQQGKTPQPLNTYRGAISHQPLASLTLLQPHRSWEDRLREVESLAKGHRAGEWWRWDSKAGVPEPCPSLSQHPQGDKMERVPSHEGTEPSSSSGGPWKLPSPSSPLTSSVCFVPFIGDTAFIISI